MRLRGNLVAGLLLLLAGLAAGCGSGSAPVVPDAPADTDPGVSDAGSADFFEVLRWAGPLHRWRTLPVTLRIAAEDAPPGYQPEMAPEVQRAVDRWNAAGIVPTVPFAPGAEAGEAMITVHFYEGRVVDGYATHGETNATHGEDGGIARVDVSLSVHTPGPIYPLALHELGHALGIWGHSPYESDIMFRDYDPGRQELSPRDLNTLRRCYQD